MKYLADQAAQETVPPIIDDGGYVDPDPGQPPQDDTEDIQG